MKISMGEALDKLSILEIKNKKISNKNKLLEIQKEKEEIEKKLNNYIKDCNYLYNCLIFINEQIWDELDIIQNDKNNLEIYKKMWAKNEQRYNIKKEIDNIYNSEFKEQKNLKEKKAFICHHLGLGDMLEMSGAVRYLAFYYDEITLVCKKNYESNVRFMYKDLKNIKYYIIEDSTKFVFDGRKNKKLYNELINAYDSLYLAGYHKYKDIHKGTTNPYDKEFYEDFGLDYKIKKVFSKTYRDEINEKILFEEFKEKLKNKGIEKYIFYHGDSSNKNIDKLKEFKENHDILVFTPNYNFYENSHIFFDIWEEKYSKLLVAQYSIFIENSNEIHMVDSSFFSLAAMLDLRHIDKKIVYLRDINCPYNNFTKFNDWEILPG